MAMRIAFLCLVLCVILRVVNTKNCQENDTKHQQDRHDSLTPQRRLKRSTYFDSPPPGATVYRRPSYGFPPRSAISYTPPPNYKMEADDPPYPQPPRSYGRKPEGLGDEDINNIVKYLSKQDLDKIITLAGRERDYQSKKVPNTERDIDYQTQVQSESHDRFSLNGPYLKANNDQDRPYRVTQEYYNPNSNSFKEVMNYINKAEIMNMQDNQDNNQNYQQLYVGTSGNLLKRQALDTQLYQESAQRNPANDLLNYVNTAKVMNMPDSQDANPNYQQLYLGNNGNLQKRQVSNTQHYGQESMISHEHYGDNLVKDNEEDLPRPINLREDTDEAISGAQTRQVASVARPDSGYKVENFGDLPVMDYHSKMFSVSSYKVPHYTITSNLYGNTPSSKAPPAEPAPPASEAKEQSDAHLKAVKIWSHRSKGQAYTLHQDGTLSLEKPLRPRRGPYGH